MDILILCTANRCRSPMVAGLLRHRLDARGTTGVHISSAGSLEADHPATADAVSVMATRGIDIAGHRSRELVPAMLEQADLVLAMARSHLRTACVEHPEAFDRTFTLKELVRRGEATRPRRADEQLPAWLGAVSDGRRPEHYLGDSTEDDVADPVGMSHRVYKRTAKELDDLVARLVALVWPDLSPDS